jgi:parvulin-like peptidyl-prolyl isomerase
MKLSRRANTIILWLVSLGLLAGMVITFTPSLGVGFGGASPAGAVALTVNGEPIRELEVAQARSNPLFVSVTEGEVGADLELLLIDTLIRREVVRQQSARQRVSDADVRRAVDEFRVSRGITGRANDSAYLNLLASSGFTDETFRVYLRQQLQQERWEASLVDGLEVTDAEARAFFEANRDSYLSEERIVARHIVTLDREAALATRARLEAGEDAAAVAAEVSVERADRGGALGAAAGETVPRPVGRPALPTAVANAAFALRGAGTTDVVESDGRFHVVVVEDYLPAAPRPFDEVAASVRDDALTAKRAGVLERAIDDLVAAARIDIPANSPLHYRNVPVARVGEVDIMSVDLVRATYSNPQIQQALSPDTAFIISAFFKPAVLAQLVDQELALQGVPELGVPFVGPRSFVAQSALNYVTRDAEVDAEDIAAHYEQNRAQFTVPASAQALQVEVTTLDAAAAFRGGVLDGGDVEEVAERVGAEVIDLGLVVPGRLPGLLDLTLFGTDAFEPIPDSPWAVSDVLVLENGPTALPESVDVAAEAAEETAAVAPFAPDRYVLLVADRRPERVRPLAEVRDQVESIVLQQERAELREAWIAELRETIPVEDSLLASAEPFGSPFAFDVLPDPAEADAEPTDAPADADVTDAPADADATDAPDDAEEAAPPATE